MSSHQDIDIVRYLTLRDERGVRLLYTHYSNPLYGIISRIVERHEEAQEVLNDVIMKIYQSITSFDDSKSQLFTWMARIARNTAIDRVRSAGHKKQSVTGELDPTQHTSITETHISDVGLATLVAKLEPEIRQIVELLYLKSYTQQECADALEIPLGTVKTRARKALMLLREGLKNEAVYLGAIVIILLWYMLKIKGL
jgi:RNA polymerase sigma-70 factor, ECF subfamily